MKPFRSNNGGDRLDTSQLQQGDCRDESRDIEKN